MGCFKELKKQLVHPQVRNYLLDGLFGLEKENVRVDQSGHLALTPHPDKLGDKNIHPYITTDFSESQVEMVTPPLPTIHELHGFMETIHDIVTEYIGDELLWPQSLPPLLPDESKIPIAKFGEAGKEKETYRELLARVYGKERQLISGIHFNFSFSDRMLSGLQESLGNTDEFGKFKEHVYFQLSRNIMRYRWLLIWLFGKSPKAEASFKVKSLTTGYYESVYCHHGISLRNCRSGYRNKEDYFIDFSDSASYQSSIKQLVKDGKLSFDKELYHPVRIKYHEDSPQISHIELRLLDLDPMEKIGISKTSLYFTHL
jgi:glutamate--cysteine ligase